MKPQDIIRAIAELDGWKFNIKSDDPCLVGRGNEWCMIHRLPNYLTSRDAIVPMIEKQSSQIKRAIERTLKESVMTIEYDYLATPSQLCEALLRATGKWDE